MGARDGLLAALEPLDHRGRAAHMIAFGRRAAHDPGAAAVLRAMGSAGTAYELPEPTSNWTWSAGPLQDVLCVPSWPIVAVAAPDAPAPKTTEPATNAVLTTIRPITGMNFTAPPCPVVRPPGLEPGT